MADEPKQHWWSAAELAEAGLPDLPTTKRKVNAMADRENWRAQPNKTRRRRGVGGGVEYHWSLLPIRARLALTTRGEASEEPRLSRSDAWTRFEKANAKAQKKAQDKLLVIRAVEEIEGAGLSRSLAVGTAATRFGVSEKAIWNWLGLIEGVESADHLPYLVDRRGTRTKTRPSAPSPEFCALVKSDFLRLSAPSFTSCYDRAVRVAEAEGIAVPPLHQVRRWYKASVSKPTELYCRKGGEALRRYFPHQTRDKSAMVPLECVQGDYHKFDLFVTWPNEPLPVRVQGVFFSDVYSGKILAWRLDLSANSHTVQLAIGDLIEEYGIPQSMLLDNGREFAAKVITGGAKTRFRFKITDEDIPGLLPMMDVKIHWATPYSGQSKPIERAFRDFCDRVSKHPAFEGAYTGNRPDAKPENYGERAIPLDEFREVLKREIDEHNARPGRRSEVAYGKSFNQVFNEAYRRAPVRRATEEQRRLWLLRAEGLRAGTKNGELKLMSSRYWAEWMYRIAGQKVAARFDVDDLHAGLHIYDLDGAYLGHAPCLEKGGFLDVEDARTHARKRKQYIRSVKKLAQAEKDLSDAEIAARVRAAGTPAPPDLPPADVVKLVTGHAKAPKPTRSRQTLDEVEAQERLNAGITRLADRRPAETEDDPEVRFNRALELEAIIAAGDALTDAQQSWLTEYQQSGEYRGQARTRAAFRQEKS